MKIRSAIPTDVQTIADLIRGLAVFEKSPEMANATPEQLRESFFGPSPRVFCDLVEVDGEVAGFAVWFLNYSTWTGNHGIYLEDLYVSDEFRGQGCGKALLAHLARECIANGYDRFQWWVLDWNTPAIDFYESLGAESMDEWTVFRMSGDALTRLADS